MLDQQIGQPSPQLSGRAIFQAKTLAQQRDRLGQLALTGAQLHHDQAQVAIPRVLAQSDPQHRHHHIGVALSSQTLEQAKQLPTGPVARTRVIENVGGVSQADRQVSRAA